MTQDYTQIQSLFADLIENTRLQSIFIQGDWVDPEAFQLAHKACEDKEVFLSQLYYNEEAGCVVAVDDYNAFAKRILEANSDLQEEESSPLPSEQNPKRLKEKNLFGKIFGMTYKSWKKFGEQGKEVLTELQDKHRISLGAAKRLKVVKGELKGEMVIRSPGYPTVLNGFLRDKDHQSFYNFFFDSK